MGQRIREIVKRGKWLYDDSIPCEVWIVKKNYFEGPPVPEEDRVPDYPPTDADGNFYLVEYIMNGSRRSVSNCFGSKDEAVLEANVKLKGRIRWDDSEPKKQ